MATDTQERFRALDALTLDTYAAWKSGGDARAAECFDAGAAELGRWAFRERERVLAGAREDDSMDAEIITLPTARPPGTVGTWNLDDLPSGPEPEPLVGPFVAPSGVTIFYGPGGVGKGFITLWLALQLVRQGQRVTVLDFESNKGEWGRRAHAIGFTQAERQMVQYREPYGDSWTARTGHLAAVVELLRVDIDHPERKADVLIVDSYSMAVAAGSELGGIAAATEFFQALKKLGRPTIVIAHVAGGGEKFPDKPFGSVQVHNSARETWAVGRVGEPDGGPMQLELRNKKANGRESPAPQFLTFTFDLLGNIKVTDDQPLESGSTLDMVLDILRRSIKPLTVDQLAAAIKADTGRAVRFERIREALTRHPILFEKTTDVPHRYGMKIAATQAPEIDLKI